MLSRICTLIPFVARTKGLLLAVRLLRIVDGIVTIMRKLRTQSARLVDFQIVSEETTDVSASQISIGRRLINHLRIVGGGRTIMVVNQGVQLADFQIASKAAGNEGAMEVGAAVAIIGVAMIGILLIVLTEKPSEHQNLFLIWKVLISLLSEKMRVDPHPHQHC
jgi:hypothetical protein